MSNNCGCIAAIGKKEKEKKRHGIFPVAVEEIFNFSDEIIILNVGVQDFIFFKDKKNTSFDLCPFIRFFLCFGPIIKVMGGWYHYQGRGRVIPLSRSWEGDTIIKVMGG